MPDKPLAYLASPITSTEKRTVVERQLLAARISTVLTHLGLRFFCPAIYSKELVENGADLTHAEWMLFDSPFLQKCDILIVLCLTGWADSKGVAMEIEYFQKRRKPIFYLTPDEDTERNILHYGN